MGKFCFLVVVESQFCICWRLAIDWGYRTSVYLACSRDCSSMVDEFLLQSPFWGSFWLLVMFMCLFRCWSTSFFVYISLGSYFVKLKLRFILVRLLMLVCFSLCTSYSFISSQWMCGFLFKKEFQRNNLPFCHFMEGINMPQQRMTFKLLYARTS